MKHRLDILSVIAPLLASGMLLIAVLVAFKRDQRPKTGAASSSPSSKLHIHSATWGVRRLGEEMDATRPLQESHRDALAICVSRDVFGEPALGKKKWLDVEYSYGSSIIRKVSREEDSLLVLPEDPELESAKSQVDHWKGCYDTAEKERQRLEKNLETANSELSTLRAKLKPKPVLEYGHVINGGNMCFEGRIGVCSLQVATIRNTRLPIPALARKVSASIEYIRDENTDRLFVASATWKNTNPPSHDMPGTVPTSTIDLESNEEQELVVSMQDKNGRVIASPEAGQSYQELSVGHWTVLVTVTSDSVPPLKLRGGLKVDRNVVENRIFVEFDSPAFTVLEGEVL